MTTRIQDQFIYFLFLSSRKQTYWSDLDDVCAAFAGEQSSLFLHGRRCQMGAALESITLDSLANLPSNPWLWTQAVKPSERMSSWEAGMCFSLSLIRADSDGDQEAKKHLILKYCRSCFSFPPTEVCFVVFLEFNEKLCLSSSPHFLVALSAHLPWLACCAHQKDDYHSAAMGCFFQVIFSYI